MPDGQREGVWKCACVVTGEPLNTRGSPPRLPHSPLSAVRIDVTHHGGSRRDRVSRSAMSRQAYTD